MNDKPRQFVDTNILVYAHDRAAGQKHATARALMESLWQSGQGCLSIQVLQEFYVTVTRKVSQPYTPAEAARIIDDLGTWHIHTPSVNDVLAAIDLQARFQISFWDALIVQSGLQLGCELIWTEDFNSGQMIHQIEIRNPFTSFTT